MAFTAVFDANVLYPAAQRDLVIRLAQRNLFRGRWTAQILDEMERAILRRQPELAARLARTRTLMCDAVPDCLVEGYEPLIDTVTLPDADDRHVLAAAIRCNAQVIVTNNTSDFPTSTLSQFGIAAQTADHFVADLVDLAPAVVAATLQRQAGALTHPPLTLDELLERLDRGGLRRSIATLRLHLDP